MVKGYNAQQADKYFCEPPEIEDAQDLEDLMDDKGNWDYDRLSGN